MTANITMKEDLDQSYQWLIKKMSQICYQTEPGMVASRTFLLLTICTTLGKFHSLSGLLYVIFEVINLVLKIWKVISIFKIIELLLLLIILD